MDETVKTSNQPDSRKELSGVEERKGYVDSQAIMQIQLGEYQAITTRITYWITLQFSVVPITGGALLLLAGAGKLFPPTFTIWAAAAIIEVGIGAYFYTIYEMMSNAEYIECELARRIRKALPDAPIWQYELFKKGSHVYSPTGIYLMMGPGISIPFVALWLHKRYWPPLSGVGDTLGSVICLGLSGVAFIIARKGSEAQKRLWECAGSAGELLTQEASGNVVGQSANPGSQPDGTAGAAPRG